MQLVDFTGIPFKVHPTPVKGKDGKQLFYVRPSGKLCASARMVDEYCSQEFHLHRGEMQRALDVFMRAAGEFIAKGYRVETPFGTFSPRLGLKREVSNPDEVTEDDVTFEGIDFRFNKDFVKDVQRWITGFRREDNPNTREILQDTQSLEQALQNSLRVHKGYTTVKSFAYHAHLTYYSAKKQLDAWTQGDTPRLLKTKMGQQYIYTDINAPNCSPILRTSKRYFSYCRKVFCVLPNGRYTALVLPTPSACPQDMFPFLWLYMACDII